MSSKVWTYFLIDRSNAKFATCKICKTIISRGGEGKNASTSPLLNHLRRHHKKEHDNIVIETNEKTPSASTQMKITDFKKWDIHDKRAQNIHILIGEMICLDNQPLSIVENRGFKRLIEKIVLAYNIPSRTFLRDNVISRIFDSLSSKVSDLLLKSSYLSLTSDIWTCCHTNVTAHFISEDWEQHILVLSCENFNGSHSGSLISQKIFSSLNKWGIDRNKVHLVIRDSAANMKKGIRDCDFDSESCFSHTLQLVINDALKSQRAVSDMITISRKIVSHFNHSSQACDELSTIQEELSEELLKVVQDVPTRWNSTFYMLGRLLKLRRSITIFSNENTNYSSNLTNNQWDLLKSTVSLLKPFEEITRAVSLEFSLISDVDPFIRTLKNFLGKTENLYGVGTLIDQLKIELEERFKMVLRNPNYLNATFLDPRYKIAFFDDEPY